MFLKKTMSFFRSVDSYLNVDSYRFARFVYLKFIDYLNVLYRFIDRFRIRNKFRVDAPEAKLHLGCGEQHKEGFINIDWRKTLATDYVCDITSLPFRDNTISLIETYHVIEHLSQKEALLAMKKWFEILKEGGVLIIECPNFDEAVGEYLDGNSNRIFNIFGYHRFPGDAHQFGYNYDRLRSALIDIGFKTIIETDPTDYHILEEPCMRVEAVK